MCPKKKKLRLAPLSLFFAIPVAAAADIDLEFELGVGYTDNITRSTDLPLDPAIDDIVYAAGMRVLVDHESARSSVDLRGSLFWHDYQDGPYESETLPGLDATAIFRITDQALSWFASGNIGQQAVDPFQPVTPGNREDIIYLTTGPSLFVPIGTRFSIRADAWVSDIRYETQPLDNTRQGAQFALARQVNPTRSLSLNIRGERTDFDVDDLLPRIDRYDAFAQFETEGSRNEVSVELGWSTVERSGDRAEEPLVGFEWQRQVSPATSFVLETGTRISDSADNFRGNQRNSIDISEVQIQQSVSDPFRENYAGITLAYAGARTSIYAGGRWSEQDYEEALSDQNRRVQRANLGFDRQLGNAWTLGVFGTLDRREYSVLLREDDDINVGLSLRWGRFRTLEIELQVTRAERNSTEVASDYTENRAYLGFRYLPSLGQ